MNEPTHTPHFNFPFRSGFDPMLSQELPFASPSGDRAVRFMSKRGELELGRLANAQVIALPMRSQRRVTMFVLLPDEGHDVRQLLSGLDEQQLRGLKLTTQEAELQLPAFEYLMPGESDSLVQSAVHSTVVRVSEEGTQAAAVTAVCMLESIRPVKQVRVNRPFIFVLDHEYAGVLALGAVQNPVAQAA